MTEAEETLLKALATAIVFGPTRHGEMRPFALARLKEAFEVGRKSNATDPERATEAGRD